MSGHDSKYFSTTKKGEIPELKEELNSQYKVTFSLSFSLSAHPYTYMIVYVLIYDSCRLGLKFLFHVCFFTAI